MRTFSSKIFPKKVFASFVYPNDRGYGGSCLPKDTAAIIKQGEDVGVDMKVLKAVEEVNKEYHER